MQTEEQRRLLGTFLRARREALQPQERGKRRRTPGLRREELAARAGIGITWCAWLEQGRDVRPSAETLSRLAAALHLSRAERTYMFGLAMRQDPEDPLAGKKDGAPAAMEALVSLLSCPAYGLDTAWNIICWNGAARRLFVGMEGMEGAPNLLRYVIMEDAAKHLIPDWEARAERIVAEFRTDFARNPANPLARAMVDQLNGESVLFRRAWQAQGVLGREGGSRSFHHPEDAALHFTQHTLHPAERPDFKLVVLQPATAESQ